MSATFLDSHGNRFLIESVVDDESDSYASLFSTATTFKARYIDTERNSATAASLYGEKSHLVSQAKPNAFSSTVMVTYIPLVSSLQGSTASTEAAALSCVQDHILLRRQVVHPLLRALFDVFYTTQCLAAPANAPSANVLRRPVEASSPTSTRPGKLAGRSINAEDGDAADREEVAMTSAAASSTSQGTALVIIEEFVDGCTLADYADAVARRRLTPNSAKLQRDGAALAYQLAQLFHYLHGTGHVVCRELTLEGISLDQNKGFISVRLPLRAVRMMEESDRQLALYGATVRVSEFGQPNDTCGSLEMESPSPLIAPELRNVALCDTARGSTHEPTSFGAADIWTLGVVTLLLCTLNHKQFAQTTRSERLGLVSVDTQRLLGLLPSDTQEGMVHLIRSCLEAQPAERPTASTVLTSTVFATNRSHTELEQHRAVISIAEAVAGANKRKMPPASLQLVESSAAAALSRSSKAATAAPDSALTHLSLQDASWDVSDVYRDVFLSNTLLSLSEVPVIPDGAAVLESGFPSLSKATQDAMQDLERLCAQSASLLSPASTAPSNAMPDVGNKQLKERLRRSRQMPRDLPATTRVMEELTERFAKLERSHPETAFRLTELLLEGFSSHPQDVEVVQESMILANALLLASRPQDSSGVVGNQEGVLEESMLSSSDEREQRDFQVGDVLRAMPSMPERMIASDRAANTSAVLYNRWLKRQKKKFVKLDGY